MGHRFTGSSKPSMALDRAWNLYGFGTGAYAHFASQIDFRLK